MGVPVRRKIRSGSLVGSSASNVHRVMQGDAKEGSESLCISDEVGFLQGALQSAKSAKHPGPVHIGMHTTYFKGRENKQGGKNAGFDCVCHTPCKRFTYIPVELPNV